MWKIDEIRYSNECFLNYLCFTENKEILAINKAYCKKKLKLNPKDLKNVLEEKKSEIAKEKHIAKSNVVLEWLALLILIKEEI